MASEFNVIKYKNDFTKANYDRIEIIVPKGQKEIIKQAAKKRNQSTNEFINKAIETYMNQSV